MSFGRDTIDASSHTDPRELDESLQPSIRVVGNESLWFPTVDARGWNELADRTQLDHS